MAADRPAPAALDASRDDASPRTRILPPPFTVLPMPTFRRRPPSGAGPGPEGGTGRAEGPPPPPPPPGGLEPRGGPGEPGGGVGLYSCVAALAPASAAPPTPPSVVAARAPLL